jgi:hypothetical protein
VLYTDVVLVTQHNPFPPAGMVRLRRVRKLLSWSCQPPNDTVTAHRQPQPVLRTLYVCNVPVGVTRLGPVRQLLPWRSSPDERARARLRHSKACCIQHAHAHLQAIGTHYKVFVTQGYHWKWCEQWCKKSSKLCSARCSAANQWTCTWCK